MGAELADMLLLWGGNYSGAWAEAGIGIDDVGSICLSDLSSWGNLLFSAFLQRKVMRVFI